MSSRHIGKIFYVSYRALSMVFSVLVMVIVNLVFSANKVRVEKSREEIEKNKNPSVVA